MIKQSVLSSTRSMRLFLYPLLPILDLVVKLDNLSCVQNSKFMSSFTTGFFVVAVRKDSVV